VSIEQIQKDADQSVAAAEAVLSQQADKGSLASQSRASDPLQADQNAE
jgi:hypothetical protein